MADDIDIKEHDVLDLLKIQDISPNLSRIKFETTDVLDEIPYVDDVGFSAAASIKAEPGTSDAYTSSNVQPHKIIFDTKPSSTQVCDPSQQLTSEDLGNPNVEALDPELERSSRYCEECEALFATVNAFDAHKMTAHSFLVALPSRNRATKSTAKKQGPKEGVTLCNHCNKTFPDIDSLIEHLYKTVTLKCDECGLTFNSENEKKSHQHVHTLVFRCSVCKSFFGKEMNFKLHMKSNHKMPEHKIDFQKRKFDRKCFFCPGYFSSLKSYNAHVSKHHSKFFFKEMSRNPSRFQQNATKNMQEVAKTSQSLAKTVTTALDNVITKPFKCVLCNMKIKYVLYHKKKFHPNLNVSDVPIIKLSSCIGKQNKGQLPLRKYTDKPRYPLTQIPKSRRSKENRNLDEYDLQKGVLSYSSREIENICLDQNSSSQNKINSASEILSTRCEQDSTVIYKCYDCGLHFMTSELLLIHFENKSRFSIEDIRDTCTVCNIEFTKDGMAEHVDLHHEKLKLNNENFNVKEMYILYQCSCQVYIHQVRDLRVHIASKHGLKQTEVKCNFCKYTFRLVEIKIHIKIFHHDRDIKRDDFTVVKYDQISLLNLYAPYPVPSTAMTSIAKHSSYTTDVSRIRKNKDTVSNAFKQTEDTVSDEIVEDAQCITIYKCYECGLHFVTPELLVSHFESRGKYNRDEIQATCAICNIDFTRDGIARHHNLHHENLKLNNENFIVKEMFLLYECSCCQMYFHDVKGFRDHVHYYENRRKITKVNCEHCNFTFSRFHMKSHLKLFHEDRNVKREDITILINEILHQTGYRSFYGTTLKAISDVEICESYIDPVDSTDVSLTPKLSNNQNISRTIYKCYDCGLHFMTSELLLIHLVSKSRWYENEFEVIRDTCTVCNIEFTKDGMAEHVDLHHEKLTLNYVDFTVEEIFILFQCSCQVLFPCYQSLKCHFKYRHNYSQKIKCNNCKYTFSSKNIRRHIEMTHIDRDIKRKDFTIVKAAQISSLSKYPYHMLSTAMTSIAKHSYNTELFKNKQTQDIVSGETNKDAQCITIYKCYECSLHFVTPALLISHFQTRSKYHTDEIREQCTLCNINFTSDGIAQHQQLHHEQVEMNHEDFTVKEMYILYECNKCQIYFHQLGGLRSHINSRHQGRHDGRRNATKCSYCNRKFSVLSIRRHIKMFHIDRNVKREDFTIVESEDTNNSSLIKQETKDPVEKHASEIIPMDISDVSSQPNTSRASTSPNNTNYKLKLHKCKPCNVYFLSQNSIYKHVHNHKPMDPKECFECKRCNLQFSIMHLHIHERKHHKQQEYQPEDILIEEFLPSVGQNEPIINIYYLKDRLQSELVSNTSEILENAASDIQYISNTNNLASNLSNKNNEDKTDEDLSVEAISVDVSAVVPEKEAFTCDFCEESFKTKITLEVHLSLYHIDEVQICDICNTSLNKYEYKSRHLCIDGEQIYYTCCICEITFKVYDLEKHALLHFLDNNNSIELGVNM